MALPAPSNRHHQGLVTYQVSYNPRDQQAVKAGYSSHERVQKLRQKRSYANKISGKRRKQLREGTGKLLNPDHKIEVRYFRRRLKSAEAHITGHPVADSSSEAEDDVPMLPDAVPEVSQANVASTPDDMPSDGRLEDSERLEINAHLDEPASAIALRRSSTADSFEALTLASEDPMDMSPDVEVGCLSDSELSSSIGSAELDLHGAAALPESTSELSEPDVVSGFAPAVMDDEADTSDVTKSHRQVARSTAKVQGTTIQGAPSRSTRSRAKAEGIVLSWSGTLGDKPLVMDQPTAGSSCPDFDPGQDTALDDFIPEDGLNSDKDSPRPSASTCEQSRQFHDACRRLESTVSSNPFAAPLLELMRHFLDHDMAKNAEAGTPNACNVMLGRVWSSTATREQETGLNVNDLLTLLPGDGKHDAWASDATMELLNALSHEDLVVQQAQSYVVPINTQGLFGLAQLRHQNLVFGSANTTLAQRLEARKAQLSSNIDNRGDGRMADQDRFPLYHMPIDTVRISMALNVRNMHWGNVGVVLDREAGCAIVFLFDPKETYALDDAKLDVPEMLSLAFRRTELGLEHLEIAPLVSMVCPQQRNDEDCGFFTAHFVQQFARNEPLDGGALQGVPDAAQGKAVRWAALKRIYECYMGKSFAFEDPVWAEMCGGKGRMGSSSSAAGQSNGKLPKSTASSSKKKKKQQSAQGNGSKARKKGKPSGRGLSKSKSSALNAQVPTGPDNAACGLDESTLSLANVASIKKHLHNWRADVRQILCNILVAADGPMAEDDLLAQLIEEVNGLAQSSGVDVSTETDHLLARARNILRRGCVTFKQHLGSSMNEEHGVSQGSDNEPNPSWTTNDGPGRLVDSASLHDLISPPKGPVRLADPIGTSYTLLVSVVRASWGVVAREDFEALDQRAIAQTKAFWRHFGRESRMPRHISTVDDIAADEALDRYMMEVTYTGSSTEVFMACEEEWANRLRDVLEHLDRQGRRYNRPLQVAFIQSGYDGLTSNNDSWQSLCERYLSGIFVDVDLITVVPARRMWHPAFFRLDEHDLAWSTVRPSRLTSLHRYDMMDSDGREYFSQAAEDSADIEDHARFLQALNIVNYMKQDHADHRRPGLGHCHIIPNDQNRLGFTLSSTHRKSFELHEEEPRVCELCGVVGDPDANTPSIWYRGTSSPLSLVCDKHHRPEERDTAMLDVDETSDEGVKKHNLAEKAAWFCRTWTIDGLKDWQAGGESDAEPSSSTPVQTRCPMPGCRKKLTVGETLSWHLVSEHAGGKEPDAKEKFNCRYEGCGKTFKRKAYRSKHEHMMHQGTKTPRPAKKLAKRKGTRGAKKLAKPTARSSLRCPFPDCNKTLTTKHGFRKHVKAHSGERINCPYPGCPVKCTPSSVSRHVDSCHTKSLIRCGEPRCGYMTKDSETYRAHLRERHTRRDCYFGKCKQSFDTTEQRNHHTLNDHEEWSWACDWENCDLILVTKATKTIHIQSHRRQEGGFICVVPVCSRTFASSTERDAHVRAEHFREGHATEAWACDWPGCGRLFGSFSGFHGHKTNDHTDTNVRVSAIEAGQELGGMVDGVDLDDSQDVASSKNIESSVSSEDDLRESTENDSDDAIDYSELDKTDDSASTSDESSIE